MCKTCSVSVARRGEALSDVNWLHGCDLLDVGSQDGSVQLLVTASRDLWLFALSDCTRSCRVKLVPFTYCIPLGFLCIGSSVLYPLLYKMVVCNGLRGQGLLLQLCL